MVVYSKPDEYTPGDPSAAASAITCRRSHPPLSGSASELDLNLQTASSSDRVSPNLRVASLVCYCTLS